MSIPRRRRNCNSARKNEVWPAVDLAQHGLGAAGMAMSIRLPSNVVSTPSGAEYQSTSSPSSGADFCACGGAGALAGASGMSHVSSAANRIGSGRRARSSRVSRLRSVSQPLPSGSIRPRYARACSPHTASRRRSASAFARAENTVKSPACVTVSVPMGLFCCRIG